MESGAEKHYEVLDLSPTATLEEVELAYQKACRTYSSDDGSISNFFSKEESEEMLKYVFDAYESIKKYLQVRESAKIQATVAPPPPAALTPVSPPAPKAFYYNYSATTGEAENFELELKKLEAEIDPALENELLKHSFYDGLILKKLRLKKKISLTVIAQKTNIGIHHLKAIETNNFKSLPAAVFVKSYVKQYSEFLELNPKSVSDSYIRLYNESKQEA